MTKTSLSSLYRRLSAASVAPALEADEIVAAADGTLPADRRDDVAATLATSPMQAKLVRMLRDLKTDSDALAFGVARTERDTAHRSHQRIERRVAAGHRFAGTTRWVGAMAACLVAIVGVWTLRHPGTAPSASPTAHTIARADVIFTSRDHIDRIFSDVDLSRGKASGQRDELFRGDFSGGG
jgi:anti-sigma factor RsiW